MRRFCLDASKEEITTHAAVKAAICQILMNLVLKTASGRFLFTSILISNKIAGVSNDPNALFLSFNSFTRKIPLGSRSKQYGEGR